MAGRIEKVGQLQVYVSYKQHRPDSCQPSLCKLVPPPLDTEGGGFKAGGTCATEFIQLLLHQGF